MTTHRELNRQLEINNVSLWMKPTWLRHDNRFLIDGVQLHVRFADESETLDRYALNPTLHPTGQMLRYGVVSEPRYAVVVDNQDAGFAEAGRYDTIALFAQYLRDAYAGSMPRTAYRPELAPGGPYADYASYRNAMGRAQGLHRAAQLCSFLGEHAYADIESATICDAIASGDMNADVAPAETRSEAIFAFDQIDPRVHIWAAIAKARNVSNGIRDYRTLGDQLCCPMCEMPKPREELVLSTRDEDGVTLSTWGCIDCVGESYSSIPLDRVNNYADAMRWTMHMFDKDYMRHPKAAASWFYALWGIFGSSIGDLH